MKRGMLNKDLHKELEFIVASDDGDKFKPEPIDFTVSPESLQNANGVSKVTLGSLAKHLVSIDVAYVCV